MNTVSRDIQDLWSIESQKKIWRLLWQIAAKHAPKTQKPVSEDDKKKIYTVIAHAKNDVTQELWQIYAENPTENGNYGLGISGKDIRENTHAIVCLNSFLLISQEMEKLHNAIGSLWNDTYQIDAVPFGTCRVHDYRKKWLYELTECNPRNRAYYLRGYRGFLGKYREDHPLENMLRKASVELLETVKLNIPLGIRLEKEHIGQNNITTILDHAHALERVFFAVKSIVDDVLGLVQVGSLKKKKKDIFSPVSFQESFFVETKMLRDIDLVLCSVKNRLETKTIDQDVFSELLVCITELEKELHEWAFVETTRGDDAAQYDVIVEKVLHEGVSLVQIELQERGI